ncbi:MAG TPA: nuclear transport factor 2 family protein [Streptosporangiaceae bacterium]|nr:nuclear transport factor 2 family protein [Streptosporangiaceae bacterium]
MSAVTDLIDVQADAFRSRDLERFIACYTDDAVIRDFRGNVMMANAAVMREQYGQLFAGSPDLDVQIPNRIESGGFVVDEEHLTGFNMPGTPSEFTAIVTYFVRDAKITEVVIAAS